MSEPATPARRPSLLLLGTRGVPARHGGFETFAERFSLYLIERGWDVTVYCQADDGRAPAHEPALTSWRGVTQATFGDGGLKGAAGTMVFDWRCIRDAATRPGAILVLGYNTAVFTAWLRLRGRAVIMNMDGIEWRRGKWSAPAKAWLYLNEQFGARASTTLVADHPEIAEHLARSRSRRDIVVIPYGSERLGDVPTEPLASLGVTPQGYLLQIGRIEPENSILELVQAYRARTRPFRFVCLGKLEAGNPYHRAVRDAAGDAVIFPGAIYDPATVQALRRYAIAHCHGHTVGGTNPSLVEALGAGDAIVAHDNRFNRWVAGPGQFYFADVAQCEAIFDRLEHDPAAVAAARAAALARWEEAFQWEPLLARYEALCAAHGGR